MRAGLKLSAFFTLWLIVGFSPKTPTSAAQDTPPETHAWPQWRGPLGTGEAPYGNPPTHWSESNGQTQNVRWKVAIPGLGHSSPIVWGEHIFLTTAIPVGDALPPRYSGAPGAHDNLPITHKHAYAALAVSRVDGSVLWKKTLAEAWPHEGGHNSASLASASPVTDGKHVFAFFGSQGLYCLDFDGHTVWKAQLGIMHTKHGHGEGSSPALYGNTLVINWDHEGQSFIVAFDKTTGQELWQRSREEVTSWSSPIIVKQHDAPQVIVAGTQRIRGYDLATGAALWECGGLSHNVVATPVYSKGVVYAGSSYETKRLMAIRIDGGRGDLTETDHVLWSRVQRTPYVPSPLLYQGSLHFLRHYQGILSRVEAATGAEPTGPFRLGGLFDVYASPVAAAGRVYVTGRNGVTVVLTGDERMSKTSHKSARG